MLLNKAFNDFRLKTLWVNFNSIEHLFPFVENVNKSFGNLDYLSMMGNPAAPSFVNGGIFHDYLIYRYLVLSNKTTTNQLQNIRGGVLKGPLMEKCYW